MHMNRIVPLPLGLVLVQLRPSRNVQLVVVSELGRMDLGLRRKYLIFSVDMIFIIWKLLATERIIDHATFLGLLEDAWSITLDIFADKKEFLMDSLNVICFIVIEHFVIYQFWVDSTSIERRRAPICHRCILARISLTMSVNWAVRRNNFTMMPPAESALLYSTLVYRFRSWFLQPPPPPSYRLSTASSINHHVEMVSKGWVVSRIACVTPENVEAVKPNDSLTFCPDNQRRFFPPEGAEFDPFNVRLRVDL